MLLLENLQWNNQWLLKCYPVNPWQDWVKFRIHCVWLTHRSPGTCWVAWCPDTSNLKTKQVNKTKIVLCSSGPWSHQFIYAFYSYFHSSTTRINCPYLFSCVWQTCNTISQLCPQVALWVCHDFPLGVTLPPRNTERHLTLGSCIQGTEILEGLCWPHGLGIQVHLGQPFFKWA